MADNRVTLEQFQAMAPEAVEALPTDQLFDLQEEIRQRVKEAKALSDKMRTALLNLHSKAADERRVATKKDTGIVHFAAPDDPDFVITGDKKIKAEWNQEELWKIVKVIQEEWEGEPSEYITTELSVSETKYKAWPKPIRALFEPARTTKLGAVSIEIERKQEKGNG